MSGSFAAKDTNTYVRGDTNNDLSWYLVLKTVHPADRLPTKQLGTLLCWRIALVLRSKREINLNSGRMHRHRQRPREMQSIKTAVAYSRTLLGTGQIEFQFL